MDQLTLLGLTAGFLTTIGFVPQMIKALRTKRMQDFSLTMPLVLMVGMGLWLMYGLVLNNFPMILWNTTAMALNGGLVLLKLIYVEPKIAK